MTLVIGGGIRRSLEKCGGHVHTCPECHEHVPCEMLCAVEPDLDLDDGTERGSFCVCDACMARFDAEAVAWADEHRIRARGVR